MDVAVEMENIQISSSTSKLGPSSANPTNPSSPSTSIVSDARQYLILFLLLGQSMSLFFFVIIPIVANLPYYSYPWINVGDPWKMVDPIFSLPLFYFILVSTPLKRPMEGRVVIDLKQGDRWKWFPRENQQISLFSLLQWVFMIGAAIYIEGHGIHTTAAMLKDPIKDLWIQSPAIKTEYPRVVEIYSYIRDDWEHIYSHYIYVIGILIMKVAQMVAWKDCVHRDLTWRLEWSLFITGFVIFSLLFAGVCIEFPGGLAVGWVWIIVYGGGWAIYLRQSILTKGKHLVIQFYLLSYVISLLIMVIYICIFGWKSREQANIAL